MLIIPVAGLAKAAIAVTISLHPAAAASTPHRSASPPRRSRSRLVAVWLLPG
jgi:hypothetical protein